MDFTRSEAEIEVSSLAAQVIATHSGDAARAGATEFDAGLWKELGKAGLLSLALPAELGGDELGVQATAAVLTEVGRPAARIPALATLALGVRRHGDLAEKETAELAHSLDVQNKRNTVMTFGGGINEVQRELIAIAGLKLPQVPR